MAIEKEVLEQLLAGRYPRDVFSRNGLFDELKKALSERILSAELDDHLDQERLAGQANRRNGSSPKTVLTETSKVALDIPRDRSGTFDPKLIAKYQRRFPGFDEKIVSMYARGMTVREIQGHLEELYGLDVSPELISRVTDTVLEAAAEWQNRPLEACYPLVFFDALRVKIRDEGFVRNKAVYIALGIQADGTKEVLGLWIEQTEGAKFWLRVMNELKTRGVADILLAVVDGLKGFSDAITAVFPETTVQTCIVHLIRHSLSFCSWKDRKQVAQALRAVYRAQDATAGLGGPGRFRGERLGRKIPADRPELAPELGARHSVLLLPGGGPADRLYHQRNRGIELQAQARGQNQGPLSQRRGCAEAAISRAEPRSGRLEEAAEGMVRGENTVRRIVRRALHKRVGKSAPSTEFWIVPLVFLTDPGLVLIPNLYLDAGLKPIPDLRDRGGEVFLKTACASSFWA